MRTRRASAFTLAASVIPLLLTVAGCGGTESTASRSAAAYDEAQRKGVAVGEPAHGAKEAHGDGGPAAEPSPHKGTVSPPMPDMDHSSMPGMKTSGRSATERLPTGDHSGMPGMGAQAPPRTDPHAGMDHSKMHGMAPSRTATDHSSMPGMGAEVQPRTDPHAGMDHSKMPGMSHDTQMSASSPEVPSATARPGQPAATLLPDPLDQPPPTSVADAARAAAMAAEMSGGGHAMSHGTYRHVDAGRDTEAPTPKPSPQAKEHKH